MKVKKFWVLLISTLALCFVIGFWLGAFPQFSKKILGQKSDTIQILTSDSNLLSITSLLAFEKATGIPVELREIPSYHLFKTEAAHADLLFAPLSWMRQFPEILKKFPADQEFHARLSSDFQSLKLGVDFFLPVLWKTEPSGNRTQLLVWGFATPHENSPHIDELLTFLFENESRLKDWANKNPELAFTLQISNDLSDFPEHQRAQKFRQVSLPSLIIDQEP